MLKKKLMAVVAACALALALPTAAFAAGNVWTVEAFGSEEIAAGTKAIASNIQESTDGKYLYEADVTITNAIPDGDVYVAATDSQYAGADVIVTGDISTSGKLTDNGMYPDYWFKINENTQNVHVKVANPNYVAPVPPATTDTTDPAADNTDNGAADNTDNSASDDKKAADNSKTSPKTGVDMGGIALATASALAAAGCVAFALRKKIAINE